MVNQDNNQIIKTDSITIEKSSGFINVGLFSKTARYLVYLQAHSKFGAILKLDQPVLNLTISLPHVIPPNQDPFFNQSMFIIRANFSNPKEPDDLTLYLP